MTTPDGTRFPAARRPLGASQWHRLGWLPLAGAGAVLELVLLLGLLRPLQIRWHPTQARTLQPLATVLGTDLTGALRFAVPVVLAFLVFAAACWFARSRSGRAPWLVLGGAVLFSVTLIPIHPLANHDVYHNIADARTFWIYGDNPAVVAPEAHAADSFYRYVVVWWDYPSVYGPLWYLLSGAPLPFAGAALWPNVIGHKLLTTAFFLVTTVLAMRAAEQVRAGTAAAAGVLVGWNPLLLFETAGNAHNDIVMICFALAAVSAALRRWWLAVFPLLALSVASKYVLVLLGPVLLVWLLRRRDVPRGQLVASLALAMVVTFILYLPFEGGISLTGFRRESDHITSSAGAVLQALLITRLQIQPEPALVLVKLVLGSIFLLGYGLTVLRIPRDADAAALARACFWVIFLLLVVAKWWFWPWYLLWLVPFGALLARERPALIAALFSATAMLLYVPYFWMVYGDWFRLQYVSFATAFALPLLLVAALYLVPHARSTLGRPASAAAR